MTDERDLLERAVRRFEPRPDFTDRVYRRRDRKHRNQRIAAGALAIILALVSFVALARAFHASERPANETTPRPPGIFSGVGGWITYGDQRAIWAVDPSHPGDPGSQIQLSAEPGTPLAWSSDGSKLLILRTRNVPHQASLGSNLFVLNADGTETRLTEGNAWITGGSFSPDGSKVVYATHPGIFVVDAAGGRPQVLLTRAGLVTPTFSPDGSRIAYFAWDRQRFRLRVMNADGSGSRALSHDVSFEDMGGDPVLVWSPDGTRLAIGYGLDIYTVRADGSDLTLVIRNGGNPNWSPDGSRIAYNREDVSYPPGPLLDIVDADGKNTQEFGNVRSGPWNPLPLSASGEEQPTATVGGSGAAPFVYALAALGVVGVFVLAWRGRRRTAAR